MEKNNIIKLIEESGYLPKIPKSFGEIFYPLLNPYDYSINEYIEKLSEYPELEAAFVNVLNHNSKKKSIENIKDAIVFLGAKNVRLIVIAYMTRLLLPDSKGRAQIFASKTYWKHCIGTSISSYMLAEKTGLSDPDKLFTYGLIHDIGVTVLDICLPEYLDKIYLKQKNGLHQIAAEKIVLEGITHSEIGSWICDEWGLPDEIAEVIAFHHSPFLSKKNITETKIMHLADSISTNYYEKLLGNKTTFIFSEKVMESLGITKEYINDIVMKLPYEVEKVIQKINFDL